MSPRKHDLQDANLEEILGASDDMISIKSVTEKELIAIVNMNLERQEKLKKEGRKVLEWSSSQSSGQEGW